MGKVNKFTLDERKSIEELLKKKVSHAKIGNLLNRHRPSITNEIKLRSINGVYNAQVAHSQVGKCSGPNNIPFTAKEIEIINNFMKENRSINNICLELKCGKKRLDKFFKQSNISYDPSGLKKYRSLQFKDMNFEQRLCSVEEHIKILTEIIKKKLCQ